MVLFVGDLQNVCDQYEAFTGMSHACISINDITQPLFKQVAKCNHVVVQFTHCYQVDAFRFDNTLGIFVLPSPDPSVTKYILDARLDHWTVELMELKKDTTPTAAYLARRIRAHMCTVAKKEKRVKRLKQKSEIRIGQDFQADVPRMNPNSDTPDRDDRLVNFTFLRPRATDTTAVEQSNDPPAAQQCVPTKIDSGAAIRGSKDARVKVLLKPRCTDIEFAEALESANMRPNLCFDAMRRSTKIAEVIEHCQKRWKHVLAEIGNPSLHLYWSLAPYQKIITTKSMEELCHLASVLNDPKAELKLYYELEEDEDEDEEDASSSSDEE